MDTPKSSFAYAVHDLARSMRRWIEGNIATPGLTMPQLRAVAQLCKQDGISQAALAALIDSDPMTLSGIVERLEAKGLVERMPDPNDSRAKIVRVTDAGLELYQQLKATVAEANEQMFEGISEEERRITFDVIARVNANLKSTDIQQQDTSR